MIGVIGVIGFLFGVMGMGSENIGLPFLIAIAGAGLMYLEVLLESKKNHKRNSCHDASRPSFLR
mgnify:CR=1 FL=1